MQVSLDRLFDGIAAALREVVLPAVDDPYARSQVTAAVELLGNLSTRVEWRRDQATALVELVRHVLSELGRDLPEPTGDPVEDRRAHLAALAAVAAEDPLPEPVRLLLVADLEDELARLRTGQYRSPAR